MPLNEVNRASLHDWEVESLRATAFLSPEGEIKPDNWWRDVVGSEPETQVFQSKLGQKHHQGTFGGGQLTLRILPSRIDWILGKLQGIAVGGATTPEPDAGGIPTIGHFDEICPRFSELITRWFHLGPSLTRLAFGVIVLLPISDRVEGYRRLAAYLPALKIDAEGSSDLLYRINRKRNSESGIENLRLNRLSTWSVASVEYKQIEITSGRATVASGEPAYTCRVEMDINTAPDFPGNFLPEKCPAVFEELIRIGSEILEKGDVP